MAQTKDVDMVLVMGLSGAGKSYFINALTGAQTGSENEARVGKRLKSCKKRKATTICLSADSFARYYKVSGSRNGHWEHRFRYSEF